MSSFYHAYLSGSEIFALNDPFFRQNGFTASPILLQCFITLKCPLNCAHCLAVDSKNSIREKEISLELFEKLVAEISQTGVQELLLTGGEPLAHPRFSDLLAIVRKYNMSWSINTAVSPSPEQKESIRSYPPIFAALSLDGPEVVHNAIRGTSEAYREIIESVKFFMSLDGTRVCAGTTVSSKNIHCLEKTFKIIMNLDVDDWGIHLILPEGRAEKRNDLMLQNRELKKLLKYVMEKRKTFPVSIADEIGYAGEWDAFVRDTSFFCSAGKAQCVVLPDGNVMPCTTLNLEYSEGNINNSSLAEIWRSGFYAQRQYKAAGKCGKCEYQKLCEGGCWLQRIHGSECFKPIYKMPPSLKKAAGISLLAAGLVSCRSDLSENADLKYNTDKQDALKTPLVSIDNASDKIETTAREDISVEANSKDDLVLPDISSLTPDNRALVLPALFGMKSGSHRNRNQAELQMFFILKEMIKIQNEGGSFGQNKKLRPLLTSLTLLALNKVKITPSAPNGLGECDLKTIKFLFEYLSDSVEWKTDTVSRMNYLFAIYALLDNYDYTRIPKIQTVSRKSMEKILADNSFTLEKDNDLILSMFAITIDKALAQFSDYSLIDKLKIAQASCQKTIKQRIENLKHEKKKSVSNELSAVIFLYYFISCENIEKHVDEIRSCYKIILENHNKKGAERFISIDTFMETLSSPKFKKTWQRKILAQNILLYDSLEEKTLPANTRMQSSKRLKKLMNNKRFLKLPPDTPLAEFAESYFKEKTDRDVFTTVLLVNLLSIK